MTTVGYGDHYPTSGEGRDICAGLMLAGSAVLGVVAASIASWMVEPVRSVEADARAATSADIAGLRAEIARRTTALARRRSCCRRPAHRAPVLGA